MAMTCPNGCDKSTLLRKDIAGHVSTECPLTIVSCPYGCGTMNGTLTRHAFQAHIDDSVEVHLQMLAKKVEVCDYNAIQPLYCIF